MKNIPISMLITARVISAMLGFVPAISFMRSINRTYNIHMGRLVGSRLNFGFWTSVLFLGICMAVFVLSIWYARGRHMYPLRRVDYLFLLVLCGAGFTACAGIVWQQLRWGAVWVHRAAIPLTMTMGTIWTNLLVLPMIAYVFAIIALGELAARLRDRTLLPTLYWARFFRVYSIWRPIGFFALLLLFGQFVLAVAYFFLPIVLVLSLASIGAFTYCAAHMLDLAAEYDIANAEKIRSERFKSELITNVSHDIRTPLTSIINYVDLLNSVGLQGQASEYVDVLVRKSGRLKTLIDDLMEASKAGTGNMRVELAEINLTEIVGQVAGEFEDSFIDNGLTLVLRQRAELGNSPAPVIVLADSRHLYRALENLFSNAAKYALSGTRVFAEIMQHEGNMLFTLQNTSAVPIELTDGELTEQFMRGDKARLTEGNGLGLYIAKSLVELMGGSLEIRVVGDLFRVEVIL